MGVAVSGLRLDAAGHEAAHAVVAVLTGLIVSRVSIDLTRAEQDRYGVVAMIVAHRPPREWPVRLSVTAWQDTLAAAYAWQTSSSGRCADAWDLSGADRDGYDKYGDVAAFTETAASVRDRYGFDRGGAGADAVGAVRDQLLADGEMTGASVAGLLAGLGLVPAAAVQALAVLDAALLRYAASIDDPGSED
jgi:hypothetical protein